MLQKILTVAFSLATLVLTAQTPARYSRVAIDLHHMQQDMARLGALGLPIDHVDIRERSCIIELSAQDIDRVRAEGFRVNVLIEDVAAWYRARRDEAAPDDRALGWLCDGPTTYTVPTNFPTGSMGGYFTLAEMEAQLDAMAALYPGLISVKAPIGTSHEGRPIHYVRISNAPDTDQPDKPEVLYSAVHHAREPASMAQLLFFMWWLLENHGTDPEATYLIENRELYFVPCLNPDGYVYNETTDPDGGGMWRKNRRDNGDGTYGVDLNRNYGTQWGADDEGSSPFTDSETYRGPAPFSEPETQAMRAFCNAHEFRAALNYHAFGDMVLHPWGYQPDLLTPDSALFTAHAERVTRNNGYSHGTCQQVLYYLANGSSDDWMYGEQSEKPKIMAMTPETGQADEGFWPPSWRIEPICQENMDQNLLQAHMVGSHTVANDLSHPIWEQLNVHVPFAVRRLGMDPSTVSVAIEPLENVASAGAPRTFTDLDLLETRIDSIAVTLPPGLNDGAPVRFILAVSNGAYTHRDTVERRFGQLQIAFSDDGSSMASWEPENWGVSTAVWRSPPSSIADSPLGNYAPFEQNKMTLEEPIDLTNATSATLRFWARWDISQVRDRLLVSARSDLAWIPLCGIHTRPGSYFQDNDVPVIEGRQFEWVQEEMSLDAFIGEQVLLRFELRSLTDFTRDGVHIDDLEVLTTQDAVSGMGSVAGTGAGIRCVPGPADEQFTLWTEGGQGQQHLSMHDGLSKVVLERSFVGGSLVVDVAHLAKGVYTCAVTAAGRPLQATRLVIAR